MGANVVVFFKMAESNPSILEKIAIFVKYKKRLEQAQKVWFLSAFTLFL